MWWKLCIITRTWRVKSWSIILQSKLLLGYIPAIVCMYFFETYFGICRRVKNIWRPYTYFSCGHFVLPQVLFVVTLVQRSYDAFLFRWILRGLRFQSRGRCCVSTTLSDILELLLYCCVHFGRQHVNVERTTPSPPPQYFTSFIVTDFHTNALLLLCKTNNSNLSYYFYCFSLYY